jgi:hypothetical protein
MTSEARIALVQIFSVCLDALEDAGWEEKAA